MNKSVTALCIMLSLCYLSYSIPLLQYEQIIDELIRLTQNFNQQFKCNSSLVPMLGETKNVSVSEVSCRALRSLKKACKNDKQQLFNIKKALDLQVNKTNVECSIAEVDNIDLLSFLRSLQSYFQHKRFNYKPYKTTIAH